MTRYRYVLFSSASLDDQVCRCELMPGNSISFVAKAIRFAAPDNMKLSKHPCDIYSKTEDRRTLRELGAIPIVKINGCWRKMPALSKLPLYMWDTELEQCGYHSTDDHAIGYLPMSQWDKYIAERYEWIFRRKHCG